jgi:DinB family protein
METEVAEAFRAGLDALRAMLLRVPVELAETPWRAGGWTRKQIVGHLLDSAANNRQRFVRAAADGHYAGPKYAQEAWVAAHGYADRDWETLLRWWQVEHEILAAIVDRIPEERLEAECVVGDNAPVTLRFLIEDYLAHQRWHFAQLTGGVAAYQVAFARESGAVPARGEES